VGFVVWDLEEKVTSCSKGGGLEAAVGENEEMFTEQGGKKTLGGK